MSDDARGRRASQRGHPTPLAPERAPEAAAAGGDSVIAFAPQAAMLPTSSSIEATLSAFNRSIAMRLMAPPQTQQSQQTQQTTQSTKPKPKPLVRRIQEPPEIPPPQAPTIPTSIRPTNSSKRRREEEGNAAAKVKADTTDDDKSVHVLMPNLGGAKLICRLCSKRGIKTRSRYGCTQCRLGFHVACFAVFHHPNEFASNPSPAVQDALDALDDKSASRPAARRRANNSINSFEQLTLPSLSDAQDALQDVEL